MFSSLSKCTINARNAKTLLLTHVIILNETKSEVKIQSTNFIQRKVCILQNYGSTFLDYFLVMHCCPRYKKVSLPNLLDPKIYNYS